MESSKVTKIITIIVKILFSLLSAGVCVYGVLLLFDLKYITEFRKLEEVQLDKTVYWPELMNGLYIGIGAAVAIFNFCCVTVNKNKGLLIISCVTLALSVIALVSLAVVTLAMCQTKTEDYLMQNMDSAFHNMKGNEDAGHRYHEIEEYYHCCGVNEALDYVEKLKYDKDQRKGVCCDKNLDVDACIAAADKRHGCQKVVSSKFYDKYVWGTVICSVTAFLGLVDLILNIILLRIRDKNTVKTSYITATKTTQQ